MATTETNKPATDRGEQTRKQILATAAQVFAECGYAGASLNDLIRRSGLTKGAFYFHFASKEALAVAVFEHKHQQMMAQLVGAVSKHDRALDQLVGMVHARNDIVQKDPAIRSALRLCSEIGGDAALAPSMSASMTIPIDLIAGLVRRAQAEGDVRPDLDPHAVAGVAFAAVVGIDIVSDVLSGGADLRRRSEEFLTVFLAALKPPT